MTVDKAVSLLSQMFLIQFSKEEHEALAMAIDALNADCKTEQRHGKWIDISEWYTPRHKCSICETIVDGYGSNFCPNCGADMRR